MRQQYAKHEIPALNNNINNVDSSNSNVINIQLNYDINQALDQDSWDRDFKAMEHLASDIRSIKESLVRMKKYIYSKSIEGNKVNGIEDLKGIGKMAWEFISSLYEAYWNNLVIDNKNMLLRNKVKLKFSLQAFSEPNNNKEKNIVNSPYISSLPSPIPAKFPKEVNKIFKYFKRNPFFSQKKSYTQVLSRYTNVVRETLKIKEAFPSLQNKKIEQVQKIISGEGKPKPQINMTTKTPSHKQVIIPMNEKNTINFVKNSGAHVSNIDRNLKNIKLDVMANFICIENKGVVIVANKIASTLDLQTIEKYVKSS